MAEKQTPGVPTMKSMGSSFGDWGVGLIGGGIYGLAQGLFGAGLLGSVLAPIAAASFLKGPRGTVIATVAGFQAASDILGGFFSTAGQGNNSGEEVM
ncbi:hypothetical protein ES708_06790 [subsurface metagenome]